MKKEKFYYCPSCGKMKISSNCSHCNDSIWRKSRIEPKESLHTYEHYIEVAEKRFGDPFRWLEVFETDELFINPQFNTEKHNSVKKYYPLFCPICAKHYRSFSPVEEATCGYCGKYVKLYKVKHDLVYYHVRSMVLYGDFYHYRDIVIDEELSSQPLFNRDEANKGEFETRHYVANTQNPNIPKCPTCQSTNIKKISALKRETHVLLFGIFSKTATSQFECENCGYKW